MNAQHLRVGQLVSAGNPDALAKRCPTSPSARPQSKSVRRTPMTPLSTRHGALLPVTAPLRAAHHTAFGAGSMPAAESRTRTAPARNRLLVTH